MTHRPAPLSTFRSVLLASTIGALAALAVPACGTDDSPVQDPNPVGGGGTLAPAPTAGVPATAVGGTGAAGSTPSVAGSVAPVTAGSGGASAGSGGANAGASGGGGSNDAGSGGSAGQAGTSGSGGSGGSAGSAGSGGTGGSAGSAGSGGTGGMIGNGGTVNETIIVAAGKTFDGGNKRYTAGAGLGDGSQEEGQDPVFRLEDGAKLINVVLGSPAADGIHTYGDATLQNIVWEDIGEDALTIKESGTVVLDGGSASNGEDKVFQINAASTFRVSNFKASNAGKFLRQNGNTTFKIEVFIDKCDISNMDEAITRTDSTTSTVSMTNTRYSKIGGDSTSAAVLFTGFATGNVTQSGNTHY